MIESLDPDIRAELGLWRIVEGHIATLTELETTWTIDDLLRANAYLDARQEIDNIMSKPKEKG